MLVSALFAINFFKLQTEPVGSQTGAYIFLSFAPWLFLSGLMLLVLPSFWKGGSKLTRLLNSFLGSVVWSPLEKLSLTLYACGPAVIGFTTYSIQNSIYYDGETVLIYFFGDMVILYIIAILAMSAIESQVHFLNNFLQHKLFGHENKYSVLIVEE